MGRRFRSPHRSVTGSATEPFPSPDRLLSCGDPGRGETWTRAEAPAGKLRVANGGAWRLYEPDPELIRAARAGDVAAFEELIRGCQSMVWRFLRHLLGDPVLAEDVTQETFIRVYRKLETFGSRSKFSTWVLSVARNAGIDAIRSRSRQEGLAEKMVLHLPSPSTGGEVGVEVEEALSSLSRKLREAFVLVEAVGLTYREAADALGLPEGTVKSRVFHARERLVAWMTAGEGSDGDE